VAAYSPDAWAAAFTAVAGAAAALTGLLFVALSINLDRVIKGAGLIGRAVEVLVLLVAGLIIALLLLMPAQGSSSAGLEIVAVAVTTIAWLTFIQVRAPRRTLGVTTANFVMRVLGDHLGPLLLVVGGVSLWAQTGGGLYWVVPGLIAAMVAAIIGAWVMLVEILR
jgi:modulator of FtsH protease